MIEREGQPTVVQIAEEQPVTKIPHEEISCEEDKSGEETTVFYYPSQGAPEMLERPSARKIASATSKAERKGAARREQIRDAFPRWDKKLERVRINK